MEIEICCGSYEDALIAYNCGIKRIELNSALYLGGLTPSIGTLQLVKKNTNLEVLAMVRNRGAGFHYNNDEYVVMKQDAQMLMSEGADGIVFGFLNEDRTIDKVKTKDMVELIHSYGLLAVFHRAFDCVDDPYQAIETLIECNVDRILTSGLKATALEGASLLKELIDRYGKDIEILPGCGINYKNALEIIELTGTNQIHSSGRGWVIDPTTHNDYVDFTYELSKRDAYECVSSELVTQLIGQVDF